MGGFWGQLDIALEVRSKVLSWGGESPGCSNSNGSWEGLDSWGLCLG